MTSTIDLGSLSTDEQLIKVFGRLLAGWLPTRRWFGGKGRPIESVEVVSCACLTEAADADGEPVRMWHLLVEVGFPGGGAHIHGEAHIYQVYLGARSWLPDHLRHAALPDPDKLLDRVSTRLPGDGVLHLYDALHDPELTAWLLDRLAAGDTAGPLRFTTIAGTSVQTGLRSLVLTSEQSNTSFVYGDQYIAKVFRRLSPGRNPDLELNLALAHVGSPHVAEPVGWVDCHAPDATGLADDGPATSMIVQRFLHGAADGWAMALASARDFLATDPAVGPGQAGGDFAAEAERLGQATAQVHQDLANSLPTRHLSPDDVAALLDGMFALVDSTAAQVPALRPFADGLRACLRDPAGVQPGSDVAGGDEDSDGHDESDSRDGSDGRDSSTDHDSSVESDALNGSDDADGQIDVAAQDDVSEGLGGLVFAQRVHGDYHLGQVLRTTRGWMLLDFEGEPARSVVERRAVASPLKDIAGMLRSFDYAAQSVALDEKGDTDRALQWSEWNRAAFCRGYAAISGHDPWENAAALRAFEIEKAVYEVAYEAANRPSWLSIPLAACARLSAGRS